MKFKLEELKKNNESLLNLLTQHLPDMLWVKDLNGFYIYVNQAICDGLLMAKDTQEPIGKNDIFFAQRERELHKDKKDWHTFGELCFNSDIDVIKENRAMKFEEYGNVKGKLMYLEVYKAPFYDKDGNIIGTVGAGRDITNLKKIQKELEYQATHDTLTNLPNRILFIDRLQQSMNLADKNRTKVAIIFIDLDHFKEINDSLGHHIGDKVLIEFANRIKNKVTPSDTISRFGGDEFCILLNEIKTIDSITNFIADSLQTIKDEFCIDSRTFYIGVSMGISIYPNDGKTANTLLRNADAAMYKSKNSGRNRYSFYSESMTKNALERISLEISLIKAIKNSEFMVYFQPQINIETDRIVGMEALVRWKNKSLGFVYPNKFIPLAELTGIIIEIDRIVMKKAIIQFNKWYKDGLNPGKLAINLSIKQIEDSNFLKFIENLLNEEKFDYTKLEFEVTESQIMTNINNSIKVLEHLSNLGISISIDDFGTGYSSLTYLKRLPIQKLKIDKSFIDGLPNDSEDIAITKTIINLCNTLDLKVIAEGVETIEQKKFLLNNNCKFVQGYLYSKPLSIDDMTKYLKNFNDKNFNHFNTNSI